MFVCACTLTLGPVVAGCSPDSVGLGSDAITRSTAIRTVPPETTSLADTQTTPAPTAYPTLPAVTAAPPPWTPVGWQTAQVEQFLTIVTDQLGELGVDATINHYFGYLSLDSGTQVDLTALATRLGSQAPALWKEAVKTYLLTALSPTEPVDYATYDAAAPYLRARVGEPGSLGAPLSQLISRPIAGELVVVVVIDSPDYVQPLNPARMATWGKTADELLDLAIAQTLAIPERPQVKGTYTTLTDDRYAASRILDPATVVTGIPAGGLIVFVPSADRFLAVAVDASLGLTTLNGLALQARDDNALRADRVSDDVYWWRDGTYQVLTLVGDELRVPPELAALLGG